MVDTYIINKYYNVNDSMCLDDHAWGGPGLSRDAGLAREALLPPVRACSGVSVAKSCIIRAWHLTPGPRPSGSRLLPLGWLSACAGRTISTVSTSGIAGYSRRFSGPRPRSTSLEPRDQGGTLVRPLPCPCAPGQFITLTGPASVPRSRPTMARNRYEQGPVQRLAGPAVALMNQLTYPRKFAVISLLFALPLGLAMYSLIMEMNDRIEFARKEIQGDQYFRPLQRLFEHVLQSRVLARNYAGKQVSDRAALVRKQAAISEDIAALHAIDQKLRPDTQHDEKARCAHRELEFPPRATLPTGTC